MVTGIHCRGEDLAIFPPRLFFPATFVYICSENRMSCISVDFTSVKRLRFLRLATHHKEECRNHFVRL